MRSLRDRVAVVTGAASGIGRGTSLLLAREGCTVALADINAGDLQETASAIVKLGGKASIHITDVSSLSSVRELSREVLDLHGRVHLLMNNAGVTVVDTFRTGSVEDFQWIMGVNFWGVVYGCKCFLPHLLKEDESHIVNVSSVFGLVGIPSQSYYCATKFAVRGFTEALGVELRDTPVAVSCVYPGGVRTAIAKTARFRNSWNGENREETVAGFELSARSTADQAARTILRGIQKNKRRILIGWDSRFVDVVARVSPAHASSIITGFLTRSRERLKRRERPVHPVS
jgi:NAD(P)-dependent dehydrogenase (short-subunit alcohol dehydrogenase family)